MHVVVDHLATLKGDRNINAKAITNAVNAVKSFVTNMAESFFGNEDELCLMAA